MRRSSELIFRNTAVAVLLGGYTVWNLYFAIQGKIPPSILKHFTGLPCPTTGGVRSWRCLLAGDWRGSLLFNPFAVIITLLFAGSLAMLCVRWIQKKPLVLPRYLAISWLAVLALAWIAKFILPWEYW